MLMTEAATPRRLRCSARLVMKRLAAPYDDCPGAPTAEGTEKKTKKSSWSSRNKESRRMLPSTFGRNTDWSVSKDMSLKATSCKTTDKFD